MDDARLNEIEARAGAATEGLWETFRTRPSEWAPYYGVKINDQYREIVPAKADWEGFGYGATEKDAAFIAAARTDVPELVAEVRRLSRIVGLLQDHKDLTDAKVAYHDQIVYAPESRADQRLVAMILKSRLETESAELGALLDG